jgi:predicted nuclease of predicted toxin-antitoxin system
MRFLVDESTGPGVARWLREMGYETFSVYDDARGLSDDQITLKAFVAGWILVTTDRDFGERLFHGRKPHRGIILLQAGSELPEAKIELFKRLLVGFIDRLEDQFVVVTETSVRFTRSR